MKRPRHILLASSLLTLLAAACSKDDLVPEATQPTDGADGLVEMTFTATAAPATRTTLGEKGADGEYPVLWTSGDEIVVMPAYGRFEKSELEEMKFTTSIEGGTAATATFTGRTQPSENKYIAFYPAGKLVEYSGQDFNYNIDFTLPTEQQAIAGNFESGIAPAYAITDQEGGDLEFEPMCGLVKFSLAGDVGNIKSVRFEAGGQILSGTYSCNLWFGTSDITGFESSESHVTLTGPFVAGKDYYMVVAPCSLSGGFSFTFTRNDDSIHVKSGKIEDGYIYSWDMENFGTIDLSDATFGTPSEKDITDMAFIQIVEEAACISLTRNAVGTVSLTEENLEKMASVTELNIAEKGLTDLSALKYFTGLQTLDCSRNSLTTLDVSALTNLTSLDCSDNQLTALDVSKLTNLTSLNCYRNELTKLDVSKLTNLTSLDCSFNSLTTLDVSALTKLTSLDCYRNELTKLDVSALTKLTSLYCYRNELTKLDVSKLTGLTKLDCAYNQLTALDVSNQTLLTDLDCSDNQLTAVNVSALKSLEYFSCSDNQLKALDVSKQTGLKELDCADNQLTALDVSKLTDLTHLYCSGNQLKAVNVSALKSLEYFSCAENQLTELDVSNLTHLTDLDCADNQLKELDVMNLTLLMDLDCSENRMSSLDISEFLYLYSVKCGKQTADGVTSRTLTLTLTAAQKAGGVFNASSKYNVDVNLNVVGQ